MAQTLPRIGCASWKVPKSKAVQFPPPGTGLKRYAKGLDAVEINSSFYRPHRRSTYEGWAAQVPDHFAFSVKAPRLITHFRRLSGTDADLDAFLEQVAGLGHKLGPLLFQLPPKLVCDLDIAGAFFATLRDRSDGPAVCEPRHASWFEPQADALLAEYRIGRVQADPGTVEGAGPGGYAGIVYLRLHGSPRMYYSSYDDTRLDAYAETLRQAIQAKCLAWCIFDNTASTAGITNALALQEHLRE
jgi:uncharacterized protein YecE (DUF72 family)